MVEQKRLPDHGFKFSEESNWNDIQLESNKIFFSKPLIIDVSGLAKGFAGVIRAPFRDIIPVARVTHKMFH